jgi:hypothetical protein
MYPAKNADILLLGIKKEKILEDNQQYQQNYIQFFTTPILFLEKEICVVYNTDF